MRSFLIICLFFLFNSELKEISIGAIIVTSTDLVMTDEMHWLISTKSVIQTNCYSQQMSNLVEVVSIILWPIIIRFIRIERVEV